MEKKYPIGVIEQLDKLQRHGSLSTDYCLGYKEGMNRILDEQAPAGAVWVKASEFKTHKPIYRPYRKPAMEDEGEYDYGEIYVTEDDGRIYLDVDNECNYEHQSDERWEGYEILDESAGEKEVKPPALKLEPGLKFRNVHMPGHTFFIRDIVRASNSCSVLIVNDTHGTQWTERDWNLEHTQWAFEKGEYYLPS